MIKIPLAVEFSWPAPNFVDPATRYTPIIIASSICIPVITLVVIARIYTRLWITRSFGPDDWMIIPAFITGIGFCVTSLVAIKHGWYKHVWDDRANEIIASRKLIIVNSLLGLLNVGFTKLSVLLLYWRLFPRYSGMRIAIYILVAMTAVWTIAMTVTNFLLCVPLNAYWNIFYTGKQWCVHEVQYFVGFASIDLALDVATYVLPLPELVKLKLPKRQKVALLAIFGLGVLAMAAAALRLPSLLRVSSSYDMTWEIFNAALWTEIEACVGIFCACAPALKALAQRYAPAILETLASRTEQKYYDAYGSQPFGDTFDSKTPTLLTKSTRGDIELGTTINTSTHLPKVDIEVGASNNNSHQLPEISPVKNTQMSAVLPLTESEEYLIYLKREANDGLPLSVIKA